jgi:hypothetical protein
MVTVAKMTDGKIVEIVRVAETVGFSEEKRWICVCFDFEKIYRKRDQFKWIKASDVRFVWVKEFVGA